jgi:hypothetical protein
MGWSDWLAGSDLAFGGAPTASTVPIVSHAGFLRVPLVSASAPANRLNFGEMREIGFELSCA